MVIVLVCCIHVYYDCNVMHSCSECLQTENICGWCIYNKLCNGTPTLCQNETGFLQVTTQCQCKLCDYVLDNMYVDDASLYIYYMYHVVEWR